MIINWFSGAVNVNCVCFQYCYMRKRQQSQPQSQACRHFVDSVSHVSIQCRRCILKAYLMSMYNRKSLLHFPIFSPTITNCVILFISTHVILELVLPYAYGFSFVIRTSDAALPLLNVSGKLFLLSFTLVKILFQHKLFLTWQMF